MEMKMILSIPKTISKKVNVRRLIRLSRLKSDSMVNLFACKDGVFQADNQKIGLRDKKNQVYSSADLHKKNKRQIFANQFNRLVL